MPCWIRVLNLERYGAARGRESNTVRAGAVQQCDEQRRAASLSHMPARAVLSGCWACAGDGLPARPLRGCHWRFTAE